MGIPQVTATPTKPMKLKICPATSLAILPMAKRLLSRQETEEFLDSVQLCRSETALSVALSEYRGRAVLLSGEFFWPNKIFVPKSEEWLLL